MEAIANSGHTGKIEIGLDVAASEFYDKATNTYNLSHK
jgi:enolase